MSKEKKELGLYVKYKCDKVGAKYDKKTRIEIAGPKKMLKSSIEIYNKSYDHSGIYYEEVKKK